MSAGENGDGTLGRVRGNPCVRAGRRGDDRGATRPRRRLALDSARGSARSRPRRRPRRLRGHSADRRRAAMGRELGRVGAQHAAAAVPRARVAYIYRGPLNLRIWAEKDPRTQEVVASSTTSALTSRRARSGWTAGRIRRAYAPHTWMGFSTGRWQGDRLVVETTHIKNGWHRRNGVPMSDQATMTEYLVPHERHVHAHRRDPRSRSI